jgi:hypothetical protein
MARIFPLTIGIVLISSATATLAAADFYIEMPDGSWLFIPEPLLLVFVLLSVLALGSIMTAGGSRERRTAGDDLGFPQGLGTPESSEYYDDQAAKARALKRKLDAETELAESYLKGKRVRAELDEVEYILELDTARRRQRK